MITTPSKKRIREWLTNAILTIAALFALFSFGDAAYQQTHNAQLSQQVIALTKQSIKTSNAHHVEATAIDNELVTLTNQEKTLQTQLLTVEQQTNAVVSSHSSELAETEFLQKEFLAAVPAITAGQTQLLQKLTTIEAQVQALSTEEQSQSTGG